MSTPEPEFTPVQERDVVPRGKVLVIAAAGIAITLASIGAARLLLGGGSKTGVTATAPAPAPTTIGTIEQTLVLDARRGLDLKEQQRKDLDRWGWVDRDAGVATIPIDRAMDILAKEGSR